MNETRTFYSRDNDVSFSQSSFQFTSAAFQLQFFENNFTEIGSSADFCTGLFWKINYKINYSIIKYLGELKKTAAMFIDYISNIYLLTCSFWRD